jgi:hypothetical protein
MAFTTSIGIQHSDKAWTVHVGWKVFSEIVRVHIQPVHKIRAGTYTDATNAYNEHYISKSYLAKYYRASNGSSGELKPAKMEPTICGFLELISLQSTINFLSWIGLTRRLAGDVGTYVAHTICFSATLAAIIRSLSLLSFKSVPRQGEKNIFPVIETFTVQAAIPIQRRTQATVKTWER